MEDESILAKLLGANAVDQAAFEKSFLTRLEENLKDVKETKQKGNDKPNDTDGNIDIEDASVHHVSKVVHWDYPDEKLGSQSAERRQLHEGPPISIRKQTTTRKNNSTNNFGGGFSSQPKIVTVENLETDRERKIRSGEMTPFGSEILQSSIVETPIHAKGSFLNFEKYLKEQTELQKSRRKLVTKKSKQKDYRFDEMDKRKQSNSSSDNEDDHEDNDDGVSLEAIKNKARKKMTASTSSIKKYSLDMHVIFPKKRKRKQKLGCGTNDDLRDVRRKPGKMAAETTAVYIHQSDDSEYVPSDNIASDDDCQTLTRQRSIRRQKKRTKIADYRFDEGSDWLDECSDDEHPIKSRSKKEADDGDYKYYLQRVKNWKKSERRVTGKMHSFDGGFKMPSYLWDSLYKYQKIGVKWLWELHQQRVGGILGDEMGLGKTIQIITFLAGVSCANLLFPFSNYRGLGPSIIICPATVMHQWVKEFHKWWPPFRVAILHESGSYSGSKATLIKSVQDSNGILITSYAGVVSNQNDILRYQWHYVILDEGHKIRNPDAQATLTLKQVATPHRFILSGSPLQNNLKELWSLFDFVYPGKLGTLPAFMEQFAVPITQGGYSNASEMQVATAFKCATILRNIINPYLLRRMKADVKTHLNLPEKNEQVLFCKMTDEQKTLYINYINSREIESIVHGRFNLFVGLINLRKICNHPHLFDGGPKLIKSTFSKTTPKSKSGMEDEEPRLEEDEGSDIELDPSDVFGHWTKSGKMIVVETLLKLWHKQKHKVLLFTQSRQMLCILENFVRQQNYNYLRLDGSTSIGTRQPLIQRFNVDPDLFVFILTTRVGGLGVNLTGANRIIIFDPDWNPSTDSQARERAWRIGQNRQVTIYRLITSGTIEEKIYHRQIFKQFLTNRVLKDPRQKRFFKSNDLLELFSFNEGSAKGTESEAIFAGTGSKIKFKKSKKHKSSNRGSEAKEKPSGKFRSVPFLEKQSKNEAVANDDDSCKNKDLQDSYVLQKLFSKSGVEAAFRHDSIVNTNEADYMIVEQEAERVAKEAACALKRSREQCWTADSGNVNWTGSHGIVRQSSELPKPKFGLKGVIASTSKSTSRNASSETAAGLCEPKHFSGPSLESNTCESTKPLSSSDILAIIRARNRPLTAPSTHENEGNSSAPYISVLQAEHQELFSDIRDYIAFQAVVDGQATTTELVTRFRTRLPPKETPLFKKMLGQLCTFRRVEGQGVWRLKPIFR
ncbi:unnamed protein product [Orchesella dallaii]|uniref:DNA repair and recombination protein RAD54-like n=1 Tax=Orchesella dallaii TaxID=48710 RepID=A0ABP1S1H5_9HEXA